MASTTQRSGSRAWRVVEPHALGFGVGVLVASIAAFILAGLGPDAREWVLSGIPVWLQGLGTVGACLVAAVIYAKWRQQEAAKIRADAAEKMLRAAFILTKLVRDSRFATTMQTETAKGDVLKASAEMFASLRGSTVEATAEPAAELQSYQSLARIYFGEKAAEAIGQLLDFRDEVKVAADYLSQFKSKWVEEEGEPEEVHKYDEPMEYFMWGDEWLLELLKAVGMHTDPTAVDEKRQDETDRRIASTMTILEVILVPHLTYGEGTAVAG